MRLTVPSAGPTGRELSQQSRGQISHLLFEDDRRFKEYLRFNAAALQRLGKRERLSASPLRRFGLTRQSYHLPVGRQHHSCANPRAEARAFAAR